MSQAYSYSRVRIVANFGILIRGVLLGLIGTPECE